MQRTENTENVKYGLFMYMSCIVFDVSSSRTYYNIRTLGRCIKLNTTFCEVLIEKKT